MSFVIREIPYRQLRFDPLNPAFGVKGGEKGVMKKLASSRFQWGVRLQCRDISLLSRQPMIEPLDRSRRDSALVPIHHQTAVRF